MEETKSVKIEIQPGETVLFKGKKASVTSMNPDGTFVILQNGMTIECSRGSLEPVGKVDVVDKQFKFDKDGALLDESNYWVGCIVEGLELLEDCYVNIAEYKRKRNNMKVKVVNECGELICSPEKSDITLTEIPEVPRDEDVDIQGTVDGVRDSYVHGVVLGPDGDATRKIMISGDSYNEAETDDDFVEILYIEENGYKQGKLRKKEICTLSV